MGNVTEGEDEVTEVLRARHPGWRFRWRDYPFGRQLEGVCGSDVPLVRPGPEEMTAAVVRAERDWPALGGRDW